MQVYKLCSAVQGLAVVLFQHSAVPQLLFVAVKAVIYTCRLRAVCAGAGVPAL